MNNQYIVIGIFSVIGILAVLGLIAYGQWNARKAGKDEGRKEILKRNIEDRDTEVKKSEADAESINDLRGSDLTNKLKEQYYRTMSDADDS